MSSTPLSRRGFARAAAALAASVAVPLASAQAKPEKQKLAIVVGGKPAFYFLPLTIAEQLGYFRSEGLDVEIADVADGQRAMQSLLAGSADVLCGAYEHTINMQARNQQISSIVLMGRAPQIALGVSTRAIPNYRGVADLRGRKIGVPAPGASSNMIANMVLARAGLKAADVSYVAVSNGPPAVAALRAAQIDAICNTEPVMTMLEQKGEVKIICDTRTLKGTQEIFGGPMPAASLLVSADFAQKHPNTCQAMANAIVRGLKWLQTAGPSDMIKTVPEAYLLGDRALYLASFAKVRETISTDGLMPEEGTRTALKALSAFEPAVRAAKIDLARTYTNEFARRAKERWKL